MLACVGTLVCVVPLDFLSLLQQLLMLNRRPNGTQNRTRTSLNLQKNTSWMFNSNFFFFFFFNPTSEMSGWSNSSRWSARLYRKSCTLHPTDGGKSNSRILHCVFYYLKVTSLKNDIFYATQKKKFWVISKQFLSKKYDKKIMSEFSHFHFIEWITSLQLQHPVFVLLRVLISRMSCLLLSTCTPPLVTDIMLNFQENNWENRKEIMKN